MSQTSPHIDTHLNMAALEELHAHVQGRLADELAESHILYRELTLVAHKASLPVVLKALRDDTRYQFKMLVDLTAVDWLGRVEADKPRFEVVYHLLSTLKNLRVRVKVAVAEGDTLPTATGIFSAANWYEREVWDMFGIRFDGHPDLRRLLTDYGFEGHPLRKDFPLNGHVEVYYDSAEQRVAYKPVDLPQELRCFDKQSPWDGMTGNAGLADEDNVFDKKEFA